MSGRWEHPTVKEHWYFTKVYTFVTIDKKVYAVCLDEGHTLPNCRDINVLEVKNPLTNERDWIPLNKLFN